MKLSAGLQVVLGILAEYASWSLAIYKKFTTDTDGIIIPHPSPNFAFEISLIVIGLAILCLALVQRAKKTRLATLQIICGQDITILSSVLYSSALGYAYSYTREVYWLVFVVMAAALLVVITGVFQFFKEKTPIQG